METMLLPRTRQLPRVRELMPLVSLPCPAFARTTVRFPRTRHHARKALALGRTGTAPGQTARNFGVPSQVRGTPNEVRNSYTRVARSSTAPEVRSRLRCWAARGQSGGEAQESFRGMYGEWSIDDRDKVEVLLYRAMLNLTSLSLATATLPALFPSWSQTVDAAQGSLVLPPLPAVPLDALFWSGALSLGLALTLIHIYVTPIKRALQALWALGVVGSLVLTWSIRQGGSPDASLVLFVVHHPAAVWAVGPAFAALTGLVFKEGLCYAKLEATLLVFVIPTTLLGHLTGLLNTDIERALLGVWVLLSTVFALRKFTQPLKDDIGDKSVFLFQALTPQEQEVRLKELGLGTGQK